MISKVCEFLKWDRWKKKGFDWSKKDLEAHKKSILRVSNTFCINPLYIDIRFLRHKLYSCKFSVVKISIPNLMGISNFLYVKKRAYRLWFLFAKVFSKYVQFRIISKIEKLLVSQKRKPISTIYEEHDVPFFLLFIPLRTIASS